MKKAPTMVEVYMKMIVRDPFDFGSASKKSFIDYDGNKGSVLIMRSTSFKGFEVMPVMWDQREMLIDELEEEQVNLYLIGYFNSRGVEW